MTGLLKDTVGILPAGALGVSFFYHLTSRLQRTDATVFFLQRRDSGSAARLRAQRSLLVADDTGKHSLALADLFRGDIVTCFAHHELGEVLLVCPNPDQLLSVMTELVELLERIFSDGVAPTEPLPFPIVVLCSNGIYFQRLRQLFIEKIEESILLGRLPDLWPDWMPKIVGRVLRGVTFQTGVREGFGARAVYRPGPPGITKIAGGDAGSRSRCCALLTGKGGWFELADQPSPTRLEFDKGLVNLASNLLGQLHAIDAKGNFSPLTVKALLDCGVEGEIAELCGHLFEVGRAVKVYGADEACETILADCMNHLRRFETHVPSSLQWVDLKLRQQNLEPELTPTETWLLKPLIKYARSAGLDQAATYFERLENLTLEKLTLAARASHSAADRLRSPGVSD